MKPVLVVSLNPAIDAEWRVPTVRWEEKNNVEHERRWAGGKGANVARWLQHLGAKTRLLTPLGGLTGAEFARQLRAERLPLRVVKIHEPTRVNVVVTAGTGGQIRFNPRGPRLSVTEWNNFFKMAARELKRSSCLILSGALPREAAPGTYARLIRLARQQGVPAVLDCDGEALHAGVRARPQLVKPNEHELEQWHGRPLRGGRAVLRAAQAMSRATGGWVLVSRGAEGALLVNAGQDAAWHVRAGKVRVRNTVGAGDSLLAAAVHQMLGGGVPEEWACMGVAVSAAAVQSVAGELPARSLIHRQRRSVRLARAN